MQLGYAIASRQHQVFLLSDDDRHADPHVFRGYATQAQQQRTQVPPIRLSYGDSSDPENRSATKFRTYRERFPDVVVEDVDVSGNYPFNRVSIVRADIEQPNREQFDKADRPLPHTSEGL
jgi:hypothetical protein